MALFHREKTLPFLNNFQETIFRIYNVVYKLNVWKALENYLSLSDEGVESSAKGMTNNSWTPCTISQYTKHDDNENC